MTKSVVFAAKTMVTKTPRRGKSTVVYRKIDHTSHGGHSRERTAVEDA